MKDKIELLPIPFSDILMHPPIIELGYKEEIENLINAKNLK